MEETMPETEEKQQEQETEELSVEVEETPEETSSAEETQETEEVKAEESSGKEELEDYSEGVKKRINKLTAKLREAERREKAATDYAQSVQKELETTQQKTKTLDDSFVQEFENRLSFQEKALKNELKIAIDRDDSEKQTELQKQLADLAADQNKLKSKKSKLKLKTPLKHHNLNNKLQNQLILKLKLGQKKILGLDKMSL